MTAPALANHGSVSHSLDELVGRFCDALANSRDAEWSSGDVLNVALDDTRRRADSPRLSRRMQAALLRQFASAGHVTTAWCRQHALVSGTFGTELRHPDVSWSYFRAVVNAAHRTKQDARALLEDALAKCLTVADLNALGKDDPQAVGLRATCAECGAAVTVRIQGTMASAFKGLPLACAVCTARVLHDGGDAREAPTLGALEVA